MSDMYVGLSDSLRKAGFYQGRSSDGSSVSQGLSSDRRENSGKNAPEFLRRLVGGYVHVCWSSLVVPLYIIILDNSHAGFRPLP